MQQWFTQLAQRDASGLEEVHSSTITAQVLHLEIGGHQLGADPRFEWNDPPRPLAVPDTTSPHIAHSPYIFLGEFFETFRGRRFPILSYWTLWKEYI